MRTVEKNVGRTFDMMMITYFSVEFDVYILSPSNLLENELEGIK